MTPYIELTRLICMKFRQFFLFLSFWVLFHAPLPAQTHTSVSLENQVYYILELAESRGLCGPLSGVRPYTRNTILKAIDEILRTESRRPLSGTERDVLETYRKTFSKPKPGFDFQRGGYYNETVIGKNNTVLSANIGTGAQVEGSMGLYPPPKEPLKERYFGTEEWVRLYMNGDIGGSVSYEFSAEGGLILAPREQLGEYNTYYQGFKDDPEGEFVNRAIPAFSQPLTHFPYAYKKRWDGSIYFLNNLYDYNPWPDAIAGGYNLTSELTGSFFEDKLITRLGRLSHDWGSPSLGSSLALNQAARPFLGFEAEFNPLPWFGFSSMTGALEYYNAEGIKESARTFQNAFSISMLNFNYKNYFFLNLGETVVWPKRFELGYAVPFVNSFFYQNNIGDFDNLSLFLNLKAQYPGIGSIWFSFYLDEMSLARDMFELDRTMLAIQGGAVVPLPILSFSSLKVSYTKINPYCYTHNRNFNPWYGETPMETSYTNNGVGLGYYLPPNSDEILVRFKTMPVKTITTQLQYQLIRHGADFGPDAVDGSSLLSELDPDGRGSNPVLKSHFLQDGAYQWAHIIKAGAEWAVPNVPLTLFGEAGVVLSYFTGIERGKANPGGAYSYSIIDTEDYPQSTGLIMSLGMKLFW